MEYEWTQNVSFYRETEIHMIALSKFCVQNWINIKYTQKNIIKYITYISKTIAEIKKKNPKDNCLFIITIIGDLKKKLKSSVILFEAPFCHSMYNVVAKIVTVVKII